MSADAIQTPSDLLALTQEYDGARKMILDVVLGEAAIKMADTENEIEGSLLASLTEKESIAYFENAPIETDGTTISPARQVEWVKGSFDRQVFGHVTATDTKNTLRGYRISDVNAGQFCLDSAMRRPDGRVTGPRITIQARIQPGSEDLELTKSYLGNGEFKKLEATEEDKKLVFKAANLLLTTLHVREEPVD
jgi:hypothetical protein